MSTPTTEARYTQAVIDPNRRIDELCAGYIASGEEPDIARNRAINDIRERVAQAEQRKAQAPRCDKGRPRKVTPQQIDAMRFMASDGMEYAEIGKRFGLHRTSVYHYVSAHRRLSTSAANRARHAKGAAA